MQISSFYNQSMFYIMFNANLHVHQYEQKASIKFVDAHFYQVKTKQVNWLNFNNKKYIHWKAYNIPNYAKFMTVYIIYIKSQEFLKKKNSFPDNAQSCLSSFIMSSHGILNSVWRCLIQQYAFWVSVLLF